MSTQIEGNFKRFKFCCLIYWKFSFLFEKFGKTANQPPCVISHLVFGKVLEVIRYTGHMTVPNAL